MGIEHSLKVIELDYYRLKARTFWVSVHVCCLFSYSVWTKDCKDCEVINETYLKFGWVQFFLLKRNNTKVQKKKSMTF